MKYLLISLLFCFNLLAAFEVKVTNNSNGKTFGGKFESMEKLNKWLKDNKKPLKGNECVFGDLGIIKEESIEGVKPDETFTELIIDSLGNEVEVTKYVYNRGFSIEINDITEQENEKKAKEAEKKALKDKLKKGKDLSLPELNKLMRDFYAL